MRQVRPWLEQPMRRVALRARIQRPYWKWRFKRFGEDSVLYKPDWVYGPHQIEVGDRVIILAHIWLSAEVQTWKRSEPAIKLGDGVAIRPYCTISAADSIEIEDNVVLSAFTTVVDSDHTWRGGREENIVWNPLTTAPIRIGRGTWVGERTAVLRGSNVGRFCIIGANSVVRGKIPDFSVAVGAPARVVGSTEDQVRHLIAG
jgi:acetyltransferase-like isoleucine patch superfamily enzyme